MTGSAPVPIRSPLPLEPAARARAIVAHSDAMTPSTTLFRIADEIQGGSLSAAQLARHVEASPALAARVLRVANSGFYAPLQSVSTLPRAIAVLGDVVVRQLVLASIVAARRTRLRSLHQSAVAARLTADAVRCAVASRALAQLVHMDADAAFAGGLLHDLGRIYLLEESGDTYADLSIARGAHVPLQDESELCGATHEDVGAVLADEWDLPPVIAQALRAHHRPEPASVAQLVHVADGLVTQLIHAGGAGETVSAPVAVLGIDEATWAERVPFVRREMERLLYLFD